MRRDAQKLARDGGGSELDEDHCFEIETDRRQLSGKFWPELESAGVGTYRDPILLC